jgi:hypothetical protein
MHSESQKISLLENSHTFMIEAVATPSPRATMLSDAQFAILNLVQAVELSLKELLRREHPILIFDNIDNPRNTISIGQALGRIENPKILGITIPNNEKKKIAQVFDSSSEIHFSDCFLAG